jgi:hypothetical protein
MAPLNPETVRRVLFEYQDLVAQYDALRELMAGLEPAWGEVRAALNELAKRLEG